MFAVNGLYGHIRRNNAKTALLAAGFIAIALVSHTVVRIIITGVTIMMERDPARWGLSGLGQWPGLMTWPMAAGGTTGVFTVESSPAPEWALRGLSEPAGLSSILPKGFGLIGEAMGYMVPFDLETAAVLALAALGIAWGAVKGAWAISRQTGAVALTRGENRPLYEMVDNLAIAAGMPAPRIEVVNSPAMNAYATGLTVGTARLGLTRGLLEGLDRDELEAIVAHEMTHIAHADSRLMAVAKACIDAVVPYRTGQYKTKGQILMGIVTAVVGMWMLFGAGVLALLVAFFGSVTLFAFLIKATILHAREYVADAGAVELTKNPAALISALLKVSGREEKLELSAGAAAIMFDGAAEGLLSTHPKVEDRIAAIREHARVNGYDVTAHRNRRLEAVGGAQPAASKSPGFGQRRDKALADAASTHALSSAGRPVWEDAPVFGGQAAKESLGEEIARNLRAAPRRLAKGLLLYVALIVGLTVGAPLFSMLIPLVSR